MEIVMLLVGFAAAVLIVPPKFAGTVQRLVRRNVSRLIQKNKKGDL